MQLSGTLGIVGDRSYMLFHGQTDGQTDRQASKFIDGWQFRTILDTQSLLVEKFRGPIN